jgi:hypothetical protein
MNNFEMADTLAAKYRTCNALSILMVKVVYEGLS